MKHYDIAIVGGGFAGISAALAAAREGASVIIIDKSNSFGGAAANSLVLPFMPTSTEINGRRVNLSAGIFKEITERLENYGAIYNNCFDDEALKLIANEMLTEAGVDILFHSTLVSVSNANDRISSATFATISGNVEICASYFIDCTGNAQLAYLAGCKTTLGRDGDNLCQPMTLCFRVGNVKTDEFFASIPSLNKEWKRASEAGELKNPREDILAFRTMIKNVVHFNTTRIVKKNPTDPFELTSAELLAREQVREAFDFVKKHGAGMEEAVLLSTAAEIGIRESRMIVGEYVLTEADCRAFTKFEDGIAACNYDIDIHNPEGSGTSHYYFPKGEYYTIPYRSLIPLKIKNMLVAGRCISSDHGAQASYRIMPTVTCIGQAAGVAAAMAAKAGCDVRDISVRELRETLIKNGAFLD